MKKAIVCLSSLLIIALLAACGTVPAPSAPTEGMTSDEVEPTETFAEVPTEAPTEEPTEEPTEAPTEESTEEPTEDATEPVEDETEETAPMPETAVDALMTYTDVLPSKIASYKRKLEDVPVERVLEAIEYIETASEKLGVVNEGGYYLEGGDYKIYLRRKIAFSLDTADGEVVWQVLSYVLRDDSQK